MSPHLSIVYWVQCCSYRVYSIYHFLENNFFLWLTPYLWFLVLDSWRNIKEQDTSWNEWSRWNLIVFLWFLLGIINVDFLVVLDIREGFLDDPCLLDLHRLRFAWGIIYYLFCFLGARCRRVRLCIFRTLILSSFWSLLGPFGIKIIIFANKTY